MRLLSLAFIVAGSAADYFTTRYGLARGAQELNPIYRHVGLLETKIFTTSLLVGFTCFLSDQQAFLAGAAICLILSGVAIWNILQT